MEKPHILFLVIAFCIIASSSLNAQKDNFLKLQAHFDRIVNARFDTLFDAIQTVEQWEVRRDSSRNRLRRMLWHDMQWPVDPPAVEITGKAKTDDYTLECLVLETAPKIYNTANLYIPRRGGGPFPVVLYQCGHANKRIFKHHGAWFAARGIAVLMMDNIEMGEIEFTHHGVYAHGWFHWYSRGFSPMAVEMLNAIRCLDFLCTRDDIDCNRIGATGVSGGGMATFFLSALDERVKAAAPVSGSFSTKGWVSRQLSRSHCDCQYPVNRYGMLYSEVGALTAPRAQLLCNADEDHGFPMKPFIEMVDKMAEVYSLYDANSMLRTAVVPGGHGDNEVIRLPVYSFFLKEFLGQDTTITEQGPVITLPDELLECWRDGYPLDDRLHRIDDELTPARSILPLPVSDNECRIRIIELVSQLRDEVFRYFPAENAPFEPAWEKRQSHQKRTVKKVSFNSFEDLRVRATYSLPTNTGKKSTMPAVLLLDHRRGIPVWGNEQLLEGCRWGDRAVLIVETLDRGSRALENNLRSYQDDDAPHHMKRQAMVAGTTLNSIEVYETLRALDFLRSQPEVDPARITIVGKGEVGIIGLYAALLDGSVQRIVLESPTASHHQGPCYLDILQYTDIPEVVWLMKRKVRLFGEIPLSLRMIAQQHGPGKAMIGESLLDCLP